METSHAYAKFFKSLNVFLKNQKIITPNITSNLSNFQVQYVLNHMDHCPTRKRWGKEG